METKAHHVLIGAFALAVTLFAILFSLWMAKYTADRSWDEYDVIFTEAVTGLSRGSIVQFNGIGVGEVRALSLDPDDPNQVIARIRIGAGSPVKTDTTAKLAFIGLTGVAQIQLSGGGRDSPMLKEDFPGKEVPSIVAEESALQKLLASSEDIAVTASDLLLRLKKVLSNENVAKINETLAHIEKITGSVSEQREELGQLIIDARSAAGKLDRAMSTAEKSINRFDQSMARIDDKLPQLLDNVDKSLIRIESLSRNTDQLISENREAIATFSNQGLTQVGPTLAELRNLVRELNNMSSRIDENPAAYLLGRGKPEEFKP